MTKNLKIFYWVLIVLVFILCETSYYTSPVSSFNVNDYFSFNLSTSLQPASVIRGESFYATITGTGTCVADLPSTITEGYVKGSIIAIHQETNNEIVLLSEYEMNINSFPTQAGDTITDTVQFTLSIPEDSELGTYNIIGYMTEAKVKSILWINVKSSLPETLSFGSIVCYDATSTTTTTTSTSTATTTSTSTTTTTTSTSTATTTTSTSTATTTTSMLTTNTLENTNVFVLSNLRISPDKMDVRDGVNNIAITIHVANPGDLYGSYQLYIKIDNKIVGTASIGLLGHEGQDFTFIFSNPTDIGIHIIDINGLIGYFTITNYDYTTNITASNSSSPVITSTLTSFSETNFTTIHQITSYSTLTNSSDGSPSSGADMNTLWILLIAILICDFVVLIIYLLYSQYKKRTY